MKKQWKGARVVKKAARSNDPAVRNLEAVSDVSQVGGYLR